MAIKREGHTAQFIEPSDMNITAQTLKNSIPNYQEVNLFTPKHSFVCMHLTHGHSYYTTIDYLNTKV